MGSELKISVQLFNSIVENIGPDMNISARIFNSQAYICNFVVEDLWGYLLVCMSALVLPWFVDVGWDGVDLG